jgi:hypothetical protein
VTPATYASLGKPPEAIGSIAVANVSPGLCRGGLIRRRGVRSSKSAVGSDPKCQLTSGGSVLGGSVKLSLSPAAGIFGKDYSVGALVGSGQV